MSSSVGSPRPNLPASLWSSSDRWSLGFLTNNPVLAPAEANTSIRIQMSTSIQVPVFRHDMYNTKIHCTFCTFDNKKLTMWFLFQTYFGKRTHRASVRAWGGGVQSSGPEEEYLLLAQPSSAQPSPASPAPVSGDRSVSHEDKTQDSGYFTNFAELLDPELQRREETCRESFFSRHLECQASLLLCPRPSAHMAQMSSHTKGNFLSTKWDLLQGCFQIRRWVK